MKGLLITFEGIEGSGKSVVSREAHDALARAGVAAVLVREPGGTAVSEAIRTILLDPARTDLAPRAELFLYLAARAQLVAQIIAPALAGGRAVICDRYLDASVAYQGWARGLGEEFVEGLNAAAVGGAVPDRTFILDCAVEVGFERGPSKREADGITARDRLEREDRGFHEKVREGYLRLARRNEKRVVVIDASHPLDEVLSAVLRNLEGLFSVKLTMGPI